MKNSVVQRRINRQYFLPEDNIISHRFIEGISSGYAYSLGEKNNVDVFFEFEPDDCMVSKLMKNRNFFYRYELEQLVDKIAYSLIAYGKAYVYIDIEYEVKKDKDNKEIRTISGFKLGETRGVIIKRTKGTLVFAYMGFNKKIKEITMNPNQLVIFDVKNMGYSRRYFRRLIKKLSRCDITTSSEMLTDGVEEYDFSEHLKKNKLLELKTIRGIGWTFEADGLSDSYILYNKIRLDEFKIKFLEYILNTINQGFTDCFGQDAGRIVANLKRKDYKHLWKKYMKGELTGKDLTSILF